MVFTTWLGKVSEAEERLTAGPEPVPVSVTVCGLALALSLKLSVPF